MVRITGSAASILAVVSLALAMSAAAQGPKKPGGPAPPHTAPAPHPAPVPHIAAPPRMAPQRVTPAPHFAAPPRQAPRIAAPPRQAPRIAAPPRQAPHIAAPPRQAPHIAAPPRQAPRVAAPRHPAPRVAAPHRPVPPIATAQRGRSRVARPSSAARRFAATRRGPTREPNLRTATRGPSAAARLSQQGQTRPRAQQRQERADLRAQHLQQRLEQRAQHRRLSRSEQHQLQTLQGQQAQRQQRAQMREQMRQGPTQQQEKPGIEARQSRRAARQPRVTPQAAAENRFAGPFLHDRAGSDQWLRARREHWAASEAWRHHIRAAFIPWFGAIYWPYAYLDIFDYTFWPYAYDDGYWAFAYDDFFAGIFFPYGAPYVDDAYSGPYDTYGTRGGVPSGSRAGARMQTRTAPIGVISPAARQLCEQPGTGVTAWPIEQIVDTVQPNEEQRALLDDLKNAAARAAEVFRNTCPTTVPMTPVGRLQAIVGRLQATLDAVHIVRPPLEKFYHSLSDEQKARFNGMEAGVEQQARTAYAETRGETAADQQTNACATAKPGLADLPIDRIDEVVRPTGNQEDALDRLSDATQKAVSILQAACPNSTPLTPVGRLEATEQRLNAMLTAAKTIKPALEDFYSSLNNEQKARFNMLDRNLKRGT
jgi:hypothetical protein